MSQASLSFKEHLMKNFLVGGLFLLITHGLALHSSLQAEVIKKPCPFSCKTLGYPLSCCSNWTSGRSCMVKLRNKPPCKDVHESSGEDTEVNLQTSNNSPGSAPVRHRSMAGSASNFTVSRGRGALGTKIGEQYSPGAACWDSNSNGLCERAEDRSSDGTCSVDDCLSVNLNELCAALAGSGIAVKSCG